MMAIIETAVRWPWIRSKRKAGAWQKRKLL